MSASWGLGKCSCNCRECPESRRPVGSSHLKRLADGVRFGLPAVFGYLEGLVILLQTACRTAEGQLGAHHVCKMRYSERLLLHCIPQTTDASLSRSLKYLGLRTRDPRTRLIQVPILKTLLTRECCPFCVFSFTWRLNFST